MKLKNMSKEEIQLLSYTDLTYLILKEEGSMNTPTLFKRIAELLDYSDSDYTNKIGDYYTSLALDKRFVLLENNEWDIIDRHSVKLVVEDDLDEEDEEDEEPEEEIEDEEKTEELSEENIDEESMDDDLLDDNDDMGNLTILNDEEIEEEQMLKV